MSSDETPEWERALLDADSDPPGGDSDALARLRAKLAADHDRLPSPPRFGYPRRAWQDQYWQATIRYPNGAIQTLGVSADDDERALDEVWKAIGGDADADEQPVPLEVTVEPLQQPGRRRPSPAPEGADHHDDTPGQ